MKKQKKRLGEGNLNFHIALLQFSRYPCLVRNPLLPFICILGESEFFFRFFVDRLHCWRHFEYCHMSHVICVKTIAHLVVFVEV